MISENQERLSVLTQAIHKKLERASEELTAQTDKSHANHQELLNDLVKLQNMAHDIFQRIGMNLYLN